MKKAILCCLLLAYSAAVFGITVRAEYCCGHLRSLSIHQGASDYQEHGRMGNKPCCTDQSLHLQIQSEQEQSLFSFTPFPPQIIISQILMGDMPVHLPPQLTLPEVKPAVHAPPIYLYDRVLRI